MLPIPESSVYNRKSLKKTQTIPLGKSSADGEEGRGQSVGLFAERPELSASWDFEKNAALSPAELTPGSHKRAWWRCEQGHSWQAQIKSRVAGTGCPYCAGKLVLAGYNDLGTLFPELSRQWDAGRNAPLTPAEVLTGTKQKVWWRCPRGHGWLASVASRTSAGSGCPYCTGKAVSAGENDLASIFPDIAAQWDADKNGELTPEKVTAYSNRRVWWLCESGHSYNAAVSARTKSGSGCPYCAGKKVLAGYNDLGTLYPKVAAQWHPELNGELTPEKVTAGSHRKAWWQCQDGHVWKAVIYSRTGSQQCGCPVCAGRAKRRRLRRPVPMGKE